MQPASFDPVFAGELFFVYLNQKQDSREGIARYRERPAPSAEILKTISGFSLQLANAPDLTTFRHALDAHEALLGEILGMEPIKKRLFPDYPGSVKSLGAWGGDFILATGSAEDQDYFRQKGYSVIRPYPGVYTLKPQEHPKNKEPCKKETPCRVLKSIIQSVINKKPNDYLLFQPFPSGHYIPLKIPGRAIRFEDSGHRGHSSP